MPHAHHDAFQSAVVTAVSIVVAFVYARGWLRIRRLDSSAIGAWRGQSFLLGLLSIWTAVGSPFAEFEHKLLTAHMIKHLLLMTLAPPLIFLGDPSMTLLDGLPRRIRCGLASISHSSPAQQLARGLTHPAVCWLGAAGALVIWHVPYVFMLGLQSDVWHAIEQASFLGTGFLFWWPVVPVDCRQMVTAVDTFVPFPGYFYRATFFPDFSSSATGCLSTVRVPT